MSIKEVFSLKKKVYYGNDETDNESIEECMIIGYFSSKEKLQQATLFCNDNGIPLECLYVEKFELKLKPFQNAVYILSHEYSRLEKDGSYTDFEYIFEPQISLSKCRELKKKLQSEPKFAPSLDRIYTIQPPDGFLISKYKLDIIWYPKHQKL